MIDTSTASPRSSALLADWAWPIGLRVGRRAKGLSKAKAALVDQA